LQEKEEPKEQDDGPLDLAGLHNTRLTSAITTLGKEGEVDLDKQVKKKKKKNKD